MDYSLLQKYGGQVPRYTSYPTAAQFHPGVTSKTYKKWLTELPAEKGVSLYVHIPYCRSLCWFCGCSTRVASRNSVLDNYLDGLFLEIDAVAEQLGRKQKVVHVHWGGGSPTILSPKQTLRLGKKLRDTFDITPDAEFAVEIDPRRFGLEKVAAMSEIGVNRASLGVQDISSDVQRAINRIQSLQMTLEVTNMLRMAGIDTINVDIMYGLPKQSTKHLMATLDAMIRMAPQRLAVFGYAHVPWMKKHQQLIKDEDLPGDEERLQQYEMVGETLSQAGYHAIGLDHFALPSDPLAMAQRDGTLRRNFQGYTTDGAISLIGLGASAIGLPATGFSQNEHDVAEYLKLVRDTGFATSRGVEITEDDRFRARIIECLMCDLSVDLEAVAAEFGMSPDVLGAEMMRLKPLEEDGIVRVEGWLVSVPADMRPLLRVVCAVFDVYFNAAIEQRHSRAV